MTTLLLTHPVCLQHDTGDYHPECAERLTAVLHILEHEDFLYLARDDAPQATREQLLRAHTSEHVDRILSSAPLDEGLVELDSDTIMSRLSADAALRSAGSVCAAVDEVMAKRCRNAFCAVRPPGHHAERDAAMGFCLFGNAAIGALHARDAHGLERVAVIDFDVHHGNGTQQILWNERGTFYASTHQQDAFPYTGRPEEIGPAGGGIMVNVPLPAGSTSQPFRAAFTDVILPKLRAFQPEMIIISAGFDAHAADPMAHLRLQVSDFDWVTRQLLDVAREFSQRRVVSVLEGGYDPRALAACVAAHLRAMMDG